MARFERKDTYYHQAKKEGYRARSAYKLSELQAKFQVVKKGDTVLDLGCAPGSWLQVLSALVGEGGTVIGIDTLPLSPLPFKNVKVRQADIRDLDAAAFPAGEALPFFDVITCDIAPNLSGIRDVDNANIMELFQVVKGVVQQALKKGGTFVFKSFFLEDFKVTVLDLQRLFAKVSIHKPAASRGVSPEVYLVCSGKR